MELTPLVDVVFLLLIFFLLTSTVFMQTGIEVSLPAASVAAPLGGERIEIKIDKNDQVYFQGERLGVAALQERLRQSAPAGEVPVLILGDEDCSYGRIIDVYDRCRSAGADRLWFGTVPRSEAR